MYCGLARLEHEVRGERWQAGIELVLADVHDEAVGIERGVEAEVAALAGLECLYELLSDSGASARGAVCPRGMTIITHQDDRLLRELAVTERRIDLGRVRPVGDIYAVDHQ